MYIKNLFITMASIASMTMAACSGRTDSADNADRLDDVVGAISEVKDEPGSSADDASFKYGTSYENKKFGYSIKLPEGFMAHNSDSTIEEMNGGKVFVLPPNASISTTASTPTDPKAYLMLDIDAAVIDESEGEMLIAKESDANSFTFKWHDQFGYRCLYSTFAGKNYYQLSFTYDDNSKQLYDEQVDKVIASFKAD